MDARMRKDHVKERGYENAKGMEAVVPEPVSIIFFGTGLVGELGLVARRKMQRKMV